MTISLGPPRTTAAPHRLLLPLLAFCQLIVAVDYNIVLVALPEMKDAVGFSASGLQWVVSAYALAFGGALLFAGRFTDLYGRRLGMLLGLGLYGAGSVLAAVATGPELVLVGRVAQGLGGALLTPSVLATIFAAFPEGPARFRAIAVWSGAGGVGLAAGSALGGLLTSTFGWEAVFLVNVPLVLIALAGALLAMPADPRTPSRGSLDVPGAVLATLGSVAIVFALAEGPVQGWLSPSVLAGAAVGIAAVGAFVAVERRTAEPLLPLGLLRGRHLPLTLAAMMLFLGSIGTTYYIFTIYLQDVLGESAFVTGLAFLPWGIAGIAGSRVAQAALGRLGIAGTLLSGMLVGAVATGGLALSLRPDGSLWTVILWTVLLALGQAMGFASLFAAAAVGVAPAHQGVTSALLSTFQQIGNAAGLAVLGGLAVALATRDGAASTAATAWGLQVASGTGAALLLAGAVIALAMRRSAQASG